ncbi:MAG: hypothetical protein AAF417_12650 [Pseudomonadota bacterium]
MINNLTVSVAGSGLALSDGQTVRRFVPTGPDTFMQKYADQPAVFQRAESGEVTHLLIGSPMGSLARVQGLDAPSNIRSLLSMMAVVALVAVLGYGYRLIRPKPHQTEALPRRDTVIAGLFALLTLALYAHLGMILSGNVDEFQFGLPTPTRINLALMNVSLLLGLAVIVLSGRHWISGAGAVSARLRYSAVAASAAISMWMSYYFNFVTELFR